MKINYDDLDEMYGNAPTKQSIRPSTDPVGSLTENRRKVKPGRDRTRKTYEFYENLGYYK